MLLTNLVTLNTLTLFNTWDTLYVYTYIKYVVNNYKT